MKSDQLKDDLRHRLLIAMTPILSADQLKRLEGSLTILMHGLTFDKEETALSTNVKTPNQEYLKQFLAIKMVKGLSEKTIKLYTQTVSRFFSFIDKPVPDVTANDVRYYLAIRAQRDGVTKTTQNNELLHLRSFFATLLAEEIIPHNPTSKIDRIKTQKVIREPFTELEVERLRNEAMHPSCRFPPDPKRSLAIIDFLYSTGCRVSEMVMVRKSDIDGERVKVLGKGNKERFVYLSARAQMSIMEYLKSRTDDFEWLFPGGEFRNPKNVLDKPTDKGTIESMLRKLGKRAGVPNTHPHRFRRTAATHALRRGMPIEQVSKMLGHENLNTTQIYAITDDDAVQASHRKYLT